MQAVNRAEAHGTLALADGASKNHGHSEERTNVASSSTMPLPPM